MKPIPAFVKKIIQKDNYCFTIIWNDEKVDHYRLSDLQKNCPCAGCVDENTGKRLRDPGTVKDDVRAIRLFSVGRYALRVQFNSGCSNGIYSFDFLRQFSSTQMSKVVK